VRTNTGLIVGLVVSVLLAAVFAVLWFGAYQDNKLLTRKVNYLTHQLEGNFSLLQKIAQQLAETQKQLQDTQKQLRDAQSRLAETQKQLQGAQNQLEQTQKQLRDVQAQLSQARSQLALLETRKNQLIDQLTQLNATYQQLKKKVYAGYDLVQQAKALLSNIATFPTAIFLLQVKDEWTFMRTHTYMYNHLPSGYFYHHDLYLYKHQIVMVSTSEPLYIAFFTPDQYEKWRMGRGGTPLWSDYGRIMFMPPRDGTYVLVIHNNLARDVGNFKITYQYFKTWRYYDSVSPNLASPYIVGTPGTPSRDFFRLFAIYSYWLESRQQLANEVMHQLRTSVSSTQLQLDTRTLYALSLAALLKNAGFDVSFAAIGTSWDNPFDANSFVPVVRFRSSRNPNATFYDMFNKLSGDINWMHVMTLSKSSYDGYDFYVIIDTYNVVETVDRQLSATTPFNVIYVDGVTELP